MTSYFKKFRMKSLWRSISLTVPIGARAVIALILLENVGESLTEESLGHLLQKYGKAVTCVCFMGAMPNLLKWKGWQDFFTDSLSLGKVGWYSGKNELPEGLSVQNLNI